jgi:hypothetical protein
MGRQVVVTLVCDVCKKPVDEKNAIPGQLAGNRRRFSLHMHKQCFENLTSSAEPVARRRRRGRPKGSTNKRKA